MHNPPVQDDGGRVVCVISSGKDPHPNGQSDGIRRVHGICEWEKQRVGSALKIPIIQGQGARVVIAHQNTIKTSPHKNLLTRKTWDAMHQIKVTPLAAESLGVRSMCTYVETSSLHMLLDAGVSLCPSRFRLPPHPLEFQAIIEAREKIVSYAKKADVVTISHYHFDHHTPSFEDWLCNWTDTDTARQIYEGKLVLAKNYRQNVNASQRRRGWVFEKTGGRLAKRIEPADGTEFLFGETKVKFSRPVFHGLPNTPLGWVIIMTLEHEDERMLFAPDVQGPLDNDTLQMILNEKPQLAIIGGPPLYLAGFRVDERQLVQGLKNLETLARNTPLVIIEHHLLRDAGWRDWAKQALESTVKRGNRMATAAEFLGREDILLEARRKQLYEDQPPNHEFEKWSKLPEHKLRVTKPPL